MLGKTSKFQFSLSTLTTSRFQKRQIFQKR